MGRALPVVVLAVVLMGSLRGLSAGGIASLPSLLGHTISFALPVLAVAWPLAIVLRPVMPPALRALPPVVAGTLVGLVGAAALPECKSLGAWVLAVVATALVVASRLAAALSVSVSPARLELERAALALGATPRQAVRLAASADPAERHVLLRGLALAATDGVAALAVWRIVGAHDLGLSLGLAGTSLLVNRGGIALPVVLLLALPAALRTEGRRRPAAARGARAARAQVEVTS